MNGPLMTLVLLIPEDKFRDEMWEYEDFESVLPDVILSEPIPEGWKFKAVKLEGEPIINGLCHCLLYRSGEGFPHEAVREFLEKYGIELKKTAAPRHKRPGAAFLSIKFI